MPIRLPKAQRIQDHLIAAVWIAAPFLLLSYAITKVSSAFTAVAMAQIPVYTTLLSRWLLPTQAPIPTQKTLGVIVGFLGILLLFYDQLSLASGKIFPHLLVLLAAFCYVLGARFNAVRKDVSASFRYLLYAGILLAPFWFIFSSQTFLLLADLKGLLAILYLGMVSSGIAYILARKLIQRQGVLFQSQVTYLIPLIGILLSALLFSEPITTVFLIAFFCTLVSIYFSN